MKKTLLAAPLLSTPGSTWLWRRRQVGFGLGQEQEGAGRLYRSRRQLRLVAVASLISPHYGPIGSLAVGYNNVGGRRVTASPASTNRPAIYAIRPGHNNQCNYSVEGRILARVTELVAAAILGPRAAGNRLPAQAAHFCPDSEQPSNFSARLACSPGGSNPLTSAPCSPVRLTGSPQLAVRPRPVCNDFWIFPSSANITKL